MATKFAKGYLVAHLPFLKWPIISQIVDAGLNKVFSHLINETEFGAFYLFIDFRVNQQGRDFYAAAIAHNQAKLSGTPEQKAAAELELIRRFNALVVLSS